ncbi:MAG: aminotransferase class I/II-fold pyridoxal phosphate-dependent enzyme [Spirochaetes bacterium]|nr:aminotransferase class I/II-fold pyridoxal phosphate-dependent enzyme [Spirochaetota bacterium]
MAKTHQEHPETLAIREQAPHSAEREHSVPIFMTSSFVFESAEQARAMFADEVHGNIYTRFSNPNNDEFSRKMAALENLPEGFACASGMSAIFTSMAALLKSGDHVLCARSVFGSTHQILTQIFPRWGIEFSYVDIADQLHWEKSFKPNTKMFFLETPSNPALDIIDLAAIGKICKSKGVLLNVDNCFCTPALQKPADFGADIVVHSATKYIDGQGRALGGVILAQSDIMKEIRFFARHTGPALSPFNAWLFSKSLETLDLRMERHSENALKLATALQNHADIERVIYPFLPDHPGYVLAKKQMKSGGGIVSLIVKGGVDRGRKFLDSLTMLSHTANLGDTRTIATHPASTTHSKLSDAERAAVGILPGMVRISVGLENADDILYHIGAALEKSR